MRRTGRRHVALTSRLAAQASLALRRALLALADAIVPSQLALFEQAIGVGRTQLLHAAARLRLPDLLAGGPRTAAELARSTGADEETLFRALRALAACGVFRMRRDGRFQNTRLSRAFGSSIAGSMRDFLEYLGSVPNVAAWADLDRTLSTGRSAFERVHGVTVWEWLARHPDDARTFAGAMEGVTELDAPAVAAGYPFGELACICDVGGGRGALLEEILVRHPAMRGVLFDAPQVIEDARARLARGGLGGRIVFVGGSFFERVPPGCDGYVLKDILHDWDDDAALRILDACRRAAPPGARLIVVEMLVDRRAAVSPAALVDVQMMVATEQGRQRSAEEHHRLMSRAGLRPGRVVRLPGAMSLVEGLVV